MSESLEQNFISSTTDIVRNCTGSRIGTTVAVLGGSIATLSAAYYASNKIRDIRETSRISNAIREKRAERDEHFEKLKKRVRLTDEARSIVELPVEELIRKLQDRSLTATAVYEAYLAKAVDATEKFNCITSFVPGSAEIARELDNLPQVKGPLHGVPICLKEDHDIQGMPTTLGLGKRLSKPVQKNCRLVQIFIDLGGVPFCKTNISQTLFSYGSDNPIFGQTVNHLNPALSPGGSSGGMGCLIGAGGAPIGTGSDIGGSVRIPAHFNGICSIKPTLNRLSGNGVLQCLPKCVGFKGVPGLAAKEAKTVATFFKAITSENIQNKYDPLAMPIPWDDKIFQSKKGLRIGYYTSLPFFPTLGDTGETVLKAKVALESLGHTVVPFSIKNDWKIMKLINDLLCVDHGENSHLNACFANEPAAKAQEGLRPFCGLPAWRRKLLYYLTKIPFLPSYSKRSSLLTSGGLDQSTCKDVWEMMHQKNEVISTILRDMENDNLDLLLTPVFPFPACKLNDCGILFGAIVYTIIWNLVDFPAGVVTYGKESGRNLDAYNDEGDAILKHAKKGAQEQSIGAPICVQLVGKPFKEEMVLRVMTELGSTYNN